MRQPNSFLIAVLFFAAAASGAVAQGGPPLQGGDVNPADLPAQWQLNVDAPQIQTELAGLILQGKHRSDKIFVPDMDIVITKNNKRLIPLLRFLRLLEASGSLQNDIIIFKIEGGKPVPIDILNKTFEVDNEKSSIYLEVGTSDVTNMPEIYISEDIIKLAFGFDFVWDAEKVEYRVNTNKELEIFKRRRLKVATNFSTAVTKIAEPLPETEPPARPILKKPLISFFQTESKTTASKQWSNTYKSNLIGELPTLNVWGSLLGGDYKVRLRNNLTYPSYTALPSPSSWLDYGLWTSKNERLLVNVGDTNIGLSDLVAPGINLFGASFKWLSRVEDEDSRRSFFKNTRPAFLSQEALEGYAPLGSEVELWVNNRLIDTRTVEESNLAPLGSGYYRFDGIGLLNNGINDVKVISKRQDGVIEETHSEILGSNQLMQKGQLACFGGLGTSKKNMNGELTTQGQFLGLQLLYGLFKDLTIGLTAAGQDKFSIFRDNTTGDYYPAPQRYYLAQETRSRLFNKVFATTNIGLNYDPFNQSQSLASTANVEYYTKKGRIKAQAFSYAPGYSNGITTISDRHGYVLSTSWNIFKNVFIKGSYLHIFNTLSNLFEDKQTEDLLTAAIVINNIIPRSTLQLQAAHTDRFDPFDGKINGNIYTVDLRWPVTNKFDIEGYYTFGDTIDISSTDGLKNGLPFPELGSFYSYDARLKLNYRFNAYNTISATYWRDFSFDDRIEFSHDFNINTKYNLRSRFDAGKVMETSKYYFRENLEYGLDKNGDNRIGLKFGFDEKGNKYEAGFYVALKNLFRLRDGKIKNVSATRLSPERGGLEGIVYLDLNANGHMDNGEIGVPNLSVLVDERQGAKSDRSGEFYVPLRERRDSVIVTLDTESLPAIYTPTQGLQKAYWKEGYFTRVKLGVAVLGTISGTVKLMADGNFKENVNAARVMLFKKDQETFIKDSVTAYDGSFYIGEVKPGDYILKIDKDSIPNNYELPPEPFKITITPSATPTELEDCNIFLNFKEVEEVKAETVEEKVEAPVVEKPSIKDGLVVEEVVLQAESIRSRISDFLIKVYNMYFFSGYLFYKPALSQGPSLQ